MPMAVDLSSYQARTPDDRAAISVVGDGIGRSLPSDLSEFLCSTGPGEGFIGKNYLILFSASEFIKMNEQYEVQEYAPGLFLFGSNGGGEGFAFDFGDPAIPVVMVPFIGMERKSAIRVASCFAELLVRLEADDDLFA